jgi:hypothetical protein
LHCGGDCAQSAADLLKETVEALAEAEFVSDEETHNIWTKRGVGLTVEACLHLGMAEALAQHSRAVQEIQ